MDSPFLTYHGASVAVNRGDVSLVVYVSSLTGGVSLQFTRDESHVQQILTSQEARMLADALHRVATVHEALRGVKPPLGPIPERFL